MSPVRFIDRGYVPPEFVDISEQKTLTRVAYHFRELADAGYLELIETISRRGATEHVYRGVGELCLSSEDFAGLPFAERQRLSAAGFLGMTARMERAIRLGSFDKRASRHLSWQVRKVDLKGFEELMEVLSGASVAAQRVCEEAAARLSAQKAPDSEGISVTFSLAGYESPDLKKAKRSGSPG